MSLFSVTLVLFLIMDPFGNISTFLSLLQKVPPKKQKLIILREMIFALIAMLAFNFLGELIMDELQVSSTTLHIASGTILFLIAIKILFPSTNSLRTQIQSDPKKDGEPFVVPMAIPLIAGPSLLATIILYSQLEPSEPIMLAAIGLAWLFSSLVLLFSPTLQRLLTSHGLIACERLMGMVLVLIAIQRFLEGIQLFAASCKF